ncbi:MAG: serine/threonine protein kinase, partial [Planctomycetota bacterium]|nr:serine/threonine protein kinase [Planctomycetota bacterium]
MGGLSLCVFKVKVKETSAFYAVGLTERLDGGKIDRGFDVGVAFMEQAQVKRPSGGIIEGYSILARLGKGGMGAVFKAVHMETGKLVALKILPVNLAKNKNYIRRFLREAKSAAQFDHPNLTRVYEVGNYRGIFYFSMEYVDGETLIDYLKRKGRLSPSESLEIVKQVALGLKHAHERGIIHRDIKPENIMVARDGCVKLTDMGLAKKVGAVEQDITVTGQVVGTPCYM